MKKFVTLLLAAMMLLTAMTAIAEEETAMNWAYGAMLLISFLSGLAVLLLAQKMEPLHALYAAGAAAFLGTAAELFSPSEYDTITVPITIATVLLLLV